VLEVEDAEARRKIKILLSAARNDDLLSILYSFQPAIEKKWGLMYSKIIDAYKRQRSMDFLKACDVIESILFLYTGCKYDVGEIMWDDIKKVYVDLKKEFTF